MERSALKKLWQKTLGPDADPSSVPTNCSYKPQPLLRPGVDPRLDAGESFELGALLGRGGMGEVYLARQTALHRDVALKRLRPEKRQHASARRAFVAEAVVTGQLEHPNIVPVYALETTPAGDVFLAMKRVEGLSWRRVLQGERRDDLVFHLEVLLQVCNAVAFAHSRSIVHNDLKPTNVMIGPFGEVMVLDWGIALDISAEPDPASTIRHRASITSPCGTPPYMPPELAMGHGSAIGPWTDVYLLGGILHEILTGRPPHAGDLIDMVQCSIEGVRPRLGPEVPEQLARTCRRALARHPEDRYPDVASFQQDLRQHLRHRESSQIAELAREKLESCRKQGDAAVQTEADRRRFYEGFAEAVAGFRQAHGLWEGNLEARGGEHEARLAYAQAALRCGDLGLAEAQAVELQSQDAHDLLHSIRQQRAASRRHERARRRMQVALGVLLLLTLVGLLVVNFALGKKNLEIAEQRAEAVTQQERAVEAQQLAERRGEIAEQTLNSLVHEFQTRLLDDLSSTRSRTVARELLDAAREGWEELRNTGLDAERTSLGAAQAAMRIGELELELHGDVDAARAEFETAVSLFSQQLASDPSRPEFLEGHAQALLYLGSLHLDQGRAHEAASCFSTSLLYTRRLYDEEPTDPMRLRGLSAAVGRLSAARLAEGNTAEALQLAEEALELDRKLAVQFPSSLETLLRLAFSLDQLAQILEKCDAAQHALDHFAEALAVLRACQRSFPHNARVQRDLGLALVEQGGTLHGLGRVAEADQLLEEAEELARTALSRDPLSFRNLMQMWHVQQARGDAAWNHGQLDDALGRYAETLDLGRRLLEVEPSNLKTRGNFAMVLLRLGLIRWARGEYPSAITLLEEGSAIQRQLLEQEEGGFEQRRNLALALQKLAGAHLLAGDRDAELAALQESLELRRGLFAINPGGLGTCAGLCAALELMSQRRLSEGALGATGSLLAEMGAVVAGMLELDPAAPSSLHCALALAVLEGDRQRLLRDGPAALAAYLDAVELARAAVLQQPEAVQTRNDLAMTLQKSGLGLLHVHNDLNGAASALEESLLLSEQLAAEDPSNAAARQDLSGALQNLAFLAERRGEPQRARELLERAITNQAELAARAEAFDPKLRQLEGELQGLLRLYLPQARLLPQSPKEWALLARLRLEAGEAASAVDAWARAFAEGWRSDDGGDELVAARTAAELARTDAETRPLLEARALHWLGVFVAGLEGVGAGPAGDAELAEQAAELRRFLWRDDASFEDLRGLRAFERIFAD